MGDSTRTEVIRIPCPGCAAALRAPERLIGKTLKCPKCAAPVRVEAPVVELDFADDPPAKAPPPPDPKPFLHLPPEDPPFLPALNKAFYYPVRTSAGIMFLLLMTVLWSFGTSLLLGPLFIIGAVILGGYVAAYMFNILFDTAMRDNGPHAPAGSDILELIGYFFRFFLSTAIAYLPFIGVVGYSLYNPASADTGLMQGLYWGTLVFGTIYQPMTLLIIGFTDNLFAPLNYVFGIRSILRIPRDYALTVLYFVATYAGAGLLETKVVGGLAEGGLGGLIGARLAVTFIWLYLMALQMRALGLMYVSNKTKLGWMR